LFVEEGSLDTFYPVGLMMRLYFAVFQAGTNLIYQVIIES